MSRLHLLALPAIAISATLAMAFTSTTQAAPASGPTILAVDVWEHAVRSPRSHACIVDAADYCVWR